MAFVAESKLQPLDVYGAPTTWARNADIINGGTSAGQRVAEGRHSTRHSIRFIKVA